MLERKMDRSLDRVTVFSSIDASGCGVLTLDLYRDEDKTDLCWLPPPLPECLLICPCYCTTDILKGVWHDVPSMKFIRWDCISTFAFQILSHYKTVDSVAPVSELQISDGGRFQE